MFGYLFSPRRNKQTNKYKGSNNNNSAPKQIAKVLLAENSEIILYLVKGTLRYFDPLLENLNTHSTLIYYEYVPIQTDLTFAFTWGKQALCDINIKILSVSFDFGIFVLLSLSFVFVEECVCCYVLFSLA